MTPWIIQTRPSRVTVRVTLPRLLSGAAAPTARSPGDTAVHGDDQDAPSESLREQRMRTLRSSSWAPEYQQASSAPDRSWAIAAPWFSPAGGAGISARTIPAGCAAGGGAGAWAPAIVAARKSAASAPAA